MPKYLCNASYSVDGIEGLVADGASRRVADVKKAVRAIGGKLEAFYFAFGDEDAVLILDLPDNVSAAALSLIASLPGTTTIRTTPLLTAAEIDQAAELVKTKGPKYRPPGGEV